MQRAEQILHLRSCTTEHTTLSVGDAQNQELGVRLETIA